MKSIDEALNLHIFANPISTCYIERVSFRWLFFVRKEKLKKNTSKFIAPFFIEQCKCLPVVFLIIRRQHAWWAYHVDAPKLIKQMQSRNTHCHVGVTFCNIVHTFSSKRSMTIILWFTTCKNSTQSLWVDGMSFTEYISQIQVFTCCIK